MESDRLWFLRCSHPSAGDRIIFEKVGSYTISLNPLFISYLPPVFVIEGETVQMVRSKWTAEKVLGVDDALLTGISDD